MANTYNERTVRTHTRFPTWLKRCLNSRERAYGRRLVKRSWDDDESFPTKHLWRME